MSLKKRQAVMISSLCIIFILLAVAYLLVEKHQEKSQEEPDLQLYSYQTEEIEKIHIVTEMADMTFKKIDGVWNYAEDEDFPVNQDYVETMVADVAAITASRMVTEQCENPSEYGLNEPVLSVDLQLSDGKEQNLVIGMDSTAASGSYAYAGDAKKVYIIDTSFAADFDYTLNQMMELPEVPEVEADAVTFYQVKKGNKTIFTKEYKEGETRDTDWFFNVSFSEGVSYQETEELLKQYGLDEQAYSITITYKKEGESEENATGVYQLSIGAMDDLEEYYYVKVEGQKGIWLMDTDSAEALIG